MMLYTGKKVGVSKEEKTLSYFPLFQRKMVEVPAANRPDRETFSGPCHSFCGKEPFPSRGRTRNSVRWAMAWAADLYGVCCNETCYA